MMCQSSWNQRSPQTSCTLTCSPESDQRTHYRSNRIVLWYIMPEMISISRTSAGNSVSDTRDSAAGQVCGSRNKECFQETGKIAGSKLEARHRCLLPLYEPDNVSWKQLVIPWQAIKDETSRASFPETTYFDPDSATDKQAAEVFFLLDNCSLVEDIYIAISSEETKRETKLNLHAEFTFLPDLNSQALLEIP